MKPFWGIVPTWVWPSSCLFLHHSRHPLCLQYTTPVLRGSAKPTPLTGLHARGRPTALLPCIRLSCCESYQHRGPRSEQWESMQYFRHLLKLLEALVTEDLGCHLRYLQTLSLFRPAHLFKINKPHQLCQQRFSLHFTIQLPYVFLWQPPSHPTPTPAFITSSYHSLFGRRK